jgi:hypothetical protein
MPPFSSLKIFPNFASHTRAAFSNILWNTSPSSPGDELMTRSREEYEPALLTC